MKKLTYLIFVLAMIPMLSIQAGTTRYVKATGSDSNGGTSWATAKLTLASALTASASGDVIYVAKGTYLVSATIIMGSGVNVYGGYDDATGLRDIVNNKTILQNTAADTRVLNGGNLAVETIWDGFTLTGGTRSSTGAGAQIGTNCVLSNCIISGNDNPGANQYASGGGVYMSGGKLLNCIVENNTCASSGGAGISNPSTGDVIIENCIIRNNKATGANGGGGVILRNNSVIKNCIIANNEATAGNVGGINAYGNSKVINCTVVNNKAFGSSGATYLGGTASIINTILWNNSSATNVVSKEGTVTMTNCAVQASASAGSFLLNASNGAITGPNFVNPSATIGYTTDDQSMFNWQLSTSSPCRNTGTDVSTLGVTTDILGTVRPTGSGSFDIGAYEQIPYFRSSASGYWETKNTWQSSFDNSTWISANQIPNSGATTIDILAGHEITIAAGATSSTLNINPLAKLTLNSSCFLNTNVLNIKSDATGTGTFLDNGTSTITTTHVNQYLTSGRNWYLSSPMSNANYSSLSSTSNVSYYNESSAAWIQNYTGALAVGKGYVSVSTSSTGNITFTGALNNGNINVSLSRLGASFVGYNLIGNPYPSYVNARTAINNNVNLQPTIWYRTKGAKYQFETVNTSSGLGSNIAGTGIVTGLIPPMQAFWVRTNVDNQTLNFTNIMRSHAGFATTDGGLVPTTPLKSPESIKQRVLRLQVSNAINSDEAVIYFNPNASNSFDKYDSEKMSNNNVTIPEIYSIPLHGTENLTINGLQSEAAVSSLALGFTTGETNTFSIQATEISNFDASTHIILKDNLLKIEADLTQGAYYSFASDVTNTVDRFTILFKTSGVATDMENNKISSNNFVYQKGTNQIAIYSKNALTDKINVSVFNTLGQKIADKILNSTLTTFEMPKSGIYVVSISNNCQTNTQKIILR